jgi:hypothetical protein
MTWPLLSVKIPPELQAALDKQANVPLFVRQTLAAQLGVEYTEKLPGLAGAKPATRKRVSASGVKARRAGYAAKAEAWGKTVTRRKAVEPLQDAYKALEAVLDRQLKTTT